MSFIDWECGGEWDYGQGEEELVPMNGTVITLTDRAVLISDDMNTELWVPISQMVFGDDPFGNQGGNFWKGDMIEFEIPCWLYKKLYW